MPLVPEDHVVDEAWGHVPPPPPDEEDEYDARRAARPPHKGAKTHRAGDLEEVEETYEAPAPKAKRSRKERPPDAPLVVDGKGSEHPQLNIRKNVRGPERDDGSPRVKSVRCSLGSDADHFVASRPWTRRRGRRGSDVHGPEWDGSSAGRIVRSSLAPTRIVRLCAPDRDDGSPRLGRYRS